MKMRKINFGLEKKLSGYLYILLILILAVPDLPAQPVRRLHRATIQPSLIRLQPGERQQFRILMKQRLDPVMAAKDVRWAVNDIPGGNTEFGTIDSDGVYRAPAVAPKPHEVHICAKVNNAVNHFLWATVLIGEPAAAYKLARSWGEPVNKLVHLKAPHGITFDKAGNLIVMDAGSNRVVRYRTDGTFLGEIGSGKGDSEEHHMVGGYFLKPRMAAVAADGRIFVCDEKNDDPRIQVFNSEGKFLWVFGEKGNGPGMILRAHGMGFSPRQHLFVADVDNFRINVYDDSGKFLYSWGKDGTDPGELNPPHGISVDRNGDVFVGGFYGPTQKFTSRGKFLCSFAPGVPPDRLLFQTIGGDHWGNVYVSVQGTHGKGAEVKPPFVRLLKYNNNGDFVAAVSVSRATDHLSQAIADKNGTVYALFSGKTEVGVHVFVEQ